MEKKAVVSPEELKKRIKSRQATNSYLRRDRDHYMELYEEVRTENITLHAKLDDEINREWSPVWLKEKLIKVQEENETLKKYIMALEEKRDFKEVRF